MSQNITDLLQENYFIRQLTSLFSWIISTKPENSARFPGIILKLLNERFSRT